MISRVIYEARPRRMRRMAQVYLWHRRRGTVCSMYWRVHECETFDEARRLADAWNAKTWDGILE